MFYHAFAAVPEWAPPGEDHILYSEGILKDVHYDPKGVRYTATNNTGIEFLRLSYKPTAVTLNGKKLPLRKNLESEGYVLRDLGGGDFAMQIRRNKAGPVFATRN